MSNYLLISNSVDSINGRKIPADVITKRRLDAGVWPLFKNTPHQKTMKKGERAIIYLAGSKQMKFVATAEIGELISARGYLADGDDALTDAPVQLIQLSDIKWFSEPVSIRAIKDKLDFVPKNTIKWGCVLQRGAKIISSKDAGLILRGVSRKSFEVA